ncbi:MAG: homocysteine S-methyltransferase family protein [Oscillospiraceae bacterium]|nr:homocysteine S-methyltransferase family protein [Oscillospiraceae bacterium]
MSFKERFGKEILFFDGAMGTMLQQNGLKAGELPEYMNLTAPEVLLKIHKAYLDAGCDIITANTFGANSLKFDNTKDIIAAAVKLAQDAVKNSGRECFVALDVGPLGKLLKPYGDLDFDDAYSLFAEQMTAGEKAGADLIIIETMGDLYEIKAAVLAAKENTDLPVLVSMIFDEKGILLTGADIKTAVFTLEGLGVDGIGLNCGLGPDQMLTLLDGMMKYSSTPVFVQPNAGLPVCVDGVTSYNVTPKDFAEKQLKIAEKGACALGGCCGTTPEHIAAMADLCKNVKVKPISEKNFTAVTSYSKTVIFGEKPVIIGERINPTGKKLMKEALRSNDIDYIFREGIAQTDSGAHILDMNVGLPEIDETEMMKTAVTGLQSILNTPLQIDTSDISAMETALRLYNGKAMVNSVNGKRESMDSVFPLVKKYGGVTVCLTLDENGIPDTADGRVKIAEKIIKRAAEYGISKKELVIDTLCMTVSTGADNAKITLEALNRIKNELGVNTVLGVSNVSFGLPARENLNSAFFTLAMENGLSAGIINPKNGMMMNAYYSYCALKGYDENFESYIANSSAVTPQKTADSTVDLKTAVIKGLKEQAREQTEKELAVKAPLEIINGILVPALDEVGKGFEENRVFLPGLLMSAETASVSFEVIKKAMKKSDAENKNKGKIILATVKGDIHDIGKNIVRVLLENYGFEVIDLGKDVSPQTIVDTAIKENVRLVGLSALMTTTVPAMEETIRLLKEQKSDTQVIVGGAVLTQEYADMIGAHFYSKDAMSTVRYAEKFFKETV